MLNLILKYSVCPIRINTLRHLSTTPVNHHHGFWGFHQRKTCVYNSFLMLMRMILFYYSNSLSHKLVHHIYPTRNRRNDYLYPKFNYKHMKRILLILLPVLIILYIGICWFFSNLILNPPQGDPLERMEEMLAIQGPNAQPVNDWLSVPDSFSVQSIDGITLRGWHFKSDSAQCAIIMAHGW